MSGAESTPTMVWSKLGTEGYVAEARHAHTANTITLLDGRDAMLVFGGIVGGDRVNSLLMLDIGACNLFHVTCWT